MARLVSPIVSPRVSSLLPRPTRRALLGTGLLGGAAALTACTGDDDPPAAPTTSGPPELDPGDWESVRAQFGLDPGLAHFAAFVLSPHPAPVTAAIAEHRAALDRDVEEALLRGIELEAAARDAAASYTGATPDEIALTGSTTEGIAIMYGGLDLAEGDEVLTTTHDFYSTEETLRLVAGRTGARVRHVSLYDDPARATVDEMVDRLVRAVRPRTRVIGVTWVHSSTGVRVPVREIAEALGRRRDDVLLCVDGVHGFGAVDVDLPDLGCDFLASGTHKWLFGPRGTGILYGRQWPRLTPFVPSFSGPGPAQRLTPGGYHAFEHQWALPAAFGFHEAIGRDRVAARTAELATRLKEGLSGEAGVTVVTPLDPAVSAGIVCLDLPAKPPPDAVLELRAAGIVGSATPYATSYLRLGPSLATNEDQVDAAIEAVAALV